MLDERGGSALTTALRGNHSEVARLLLELGADPNQSFLDSQVRDAAMWQEHTPPEHACRCLTSTSCCAPW